MKKIIRVFLLLLALTLLFASCEQGGEEVTQAPASTGEVTEAVAPETSAEDTAAEVTSAVTEEVTAEVTEVVTEPVTAPVTEQITEPVTEPITEPVTEPITEPVTEPITEPVTEPGTTPVTEPPHVHVFGAWRVITSPSCETKGKEERTCSCGERESRSIAAVGHSEVVDAAKSATCTESGLTEGKHCAVCKAVLVAQKTVPASGHKEEIIPGRAATCRREGLTDGKRCLVCDEVIVAQKAIASPPHTEKVMPAIEPGCRYEGKTAWSYCSVCGITLVDYRVIPAKGHTLAVTEARKPTCYSNGVTEEVYCTVCYAIITPSTIIPPTSHVEVVDPAVPATCSKYGRTEGKHCSLCGLVTVKQLSIEILPHTEVIDPAVAATCTKEGLSEGKHCSVCGKVTVKQWPTGVIPHTDVIDAAIPPTCTEIGYTIGSHCSVCGVITTPRYEKPALGHKEVIDPAVPSTYFEEGLTEGSHCSACGLVFVAQKTIAKVPAVNIEFDPFGTITTKETVIETDHLRLIVPANVYIPHNLVENLNLITSVMEEVSGLKFMGNPYYVNDLIEVRVVKIADSESEYGPALAIPGYYATVSSGDLMDLYALIHECSHMLRYSQSHWEYCQWAEESMSTYTSYKVQEYIAEHYPELMYTVDTVNMSLSNYGTSSIDKICEYPMEYWIDHTFEYSVNNNYAIGFALSWYLDEVYGDYTSWSIVYEEMIHRYQNYDAPNHLSAEEQIKAYKMAYGEDVFEGFYAWLKEHGDLFALRENDWSRVEKLQLFPRFYGHGIGFGGVTGKYKDLYMDFSFAEQFMKEYKGRSAEGMFMSITSGITVELYDSEGRLMKVVVSDGSEIYLEGVSFIKLPGEGDITYFNIAGFDSQYH